ncbi:ADP-heptose--LPS heptosyltransferase [Trinickia sp. Y13]|uniref:glycosyltransferase family 9 protein n=1 Tax=Trinickia sp. Y13 TaxID=2917807 RepID=UPI002406EA6A|nr:ADP-heptose--LPS heptosyltransferase [Trinickia sp. Y13]MDG0025290.1 ADP-heptose--LPS heptosyltransferase [Trinickia sp. Y13]
MSVLHPDDVLFHPGSLLSPLGELVAPYDLESGDASLAGYRPATADPRINNANARAFRLDWETLSAVHVVNGMGVTLGDSIIGLTAIAAIRHRFPSLRVHLYRPKRAPAYVEALYALSTGRIVDTCQCLPRAIGGGLPGREAIVDVGNHLFWRGFSREPMVDFFLDALGMDPASVASSQKRNNWLRRLPLTDASPRTVSRPYALFSPSASTSLRSIPSSQWARLVDLIHRTYGLPVLGFGQVDHPVYRDVSEQSATTAAFLGWVSGAAFVMTGDSAALHIAAGFDIPTTAFFSSIEPDLRAKDYPMCQSISLDVPSLRGLQASSRKSDLALLSGAFDRLLDEGLSLLPLPLG